jgi:cell wall-associated NlpC family hydrolase
MSLDRYIGVRFIDGGRDFDGFDCWGLVKTYYREERNIDLPEFNISSSDAKSINKNMTSEANLKKWVAVEKINIQMGDVITMSLSSRHPDFVTHVGVFIGGGKFLHTIEGQTSTISNMISPMWNQRIRGFYRWAT